MQRLQRPLLRLGAIAFFASIALTLASALAPHDAAPHFLPWDKANHFVAFYTMSFLGAASFPRWKPAWLALGLLALGAAIEILQATPLIGRDGDVLDWLADAVGIACALAPLWLVEWRKLWAEAPASTPPA